MVRLFSIIVIVVVSFQSCLSASRKTAKSSRKPYDMPTLPYGALDKNKLDTTFDYNVHQNIISFKIPDTILQGRINGGVEFYVLIDESKKIKGVELIECSLYDKRSAVYKFPTPLMKQQELKLKLEEYLVHSLAIIIFKQTKEPTLGIHKTYCFAKLYQ